MRIRTDFSHFSAFTDPALHQKDASKRPPWSKTLQGSIFDFLADPDPAFHSNADPEPASQNNADPDLLPGSFMMILFFCLFRFGRVRHVTGMVRIT